MCYKKFIVVLVLTMFNSGCAMLAHEEAISANVCNIESADYQYCHYVTTNQGNDEQDSSFSLDNSYVEGGNLNDWNQSQTGKHFKRVNEYAETLSMKLFDNIHSGSLYGTVAVTSFVNFDESLNNTNALGNQLAEGMIHELKKYGLTMVDFKNTDFVRITAAGDFAFSRDANDITSNQQIDYVLSGTLVRNPRGVVVQARIVHLGSNRVHASAKEFIPNLVLM